MFKKIAKVIKPDWSQIVNGLYATAIVYVAPIIFSATLLWFSRFDPLELRVTKGQIIAIMLYVVMAIGFGTIGYGAVRFFYRIFPPAVLRFSIALDKEIKKSSFSGRGTIFLSDIKKAPPFLGIDHSKYVLSPELERVFGEYFSAKDFKKANEGIIRGGISYIGRHGDTPKSVAKKVYGNVKFASKIPYSLFANGSHYRLPPIDTDESRGLSSEEIANIYSKADEDYIERAMKTMVSQFNLPEDEVLWLMATIYRAAQMSKAA